MWAKIWQKNQVFDHFLKFGSLVFLEIGYNDSLQQCTTSSRGTNYEKIFRDQIWCKTGQNPAQNQDFCDFLKFISLVFFKIAYNDSLQQCITSSRGKTYKKKFGDQIWGKTGQNHQFLGLQIGSKIKVFAIFPRSHNQFSLVLHKIAG